jgi:hypothetical protein
VPSPLTRRFFRQFESVDHTYASPSGFWDLMWARGKIEHGQVIQSEVVTIGMHVAGVDGRG